MPPWVSIREQMPIRVCTVQLVWLAIVFSVFCSQHVIDDQWFSIGPNDGLYFFSVAIHTRKAYVVLCLSIILDRFLVVYTDVAESPGIRARLAGAGKFVTPGTEARTTPWSTDDGVDRTNGCCGSNSGKEVWIRMQMLVEMLYKYTSLIMRGHAAFQQAGLLLILVLAQWVALQGSTYVADMAWRKVHGVDQLGRRTHSGLPVNNRDVTRIWSSFTHLGIIPIAETIAADAHAVMQPLYRLQRGTFDLFEEDDFT